MAYFDSNKNQINNLGASSRGMLLEKHFVFEASLGGLDPR